ncbi:unnamed protein product [Eruca vesicaria subsp. sativa]|uniref:Uncharacterized protein n=1 Tax=Eruca vesicaria subsp. sativa TaxID=29727 RepID=A0ABC8KNU4_ERUVS|nr:unnamed protein product [Eruca vesicaria subsp. sativa]
MEPLVKLLLKEVEGTLDCMTVLLFIATIIVFLVSSFPYKKHIRDWQINEFKVAASDHKSLVFLFYFLCCASTTINENRDDQNQTNPGLVVVLRFLIKSGYAMVSFLLFDKICVILRSKPPLESTNI